MMQDLFKSEKLFDSLTKNPLLGAFLEKKRKNTYLISILYVSSSFETVKNFRKKQIQCPELNLQVAVLLLL